MDQKLVESNQRLAAERTQQELTRSKLEAEHETAMRQLSMQRELQKQQHELAMARQRAQQELLNEEAAAERNRKVQQFRQTYTDQGFSVEDYLRLREIEAAATLTGNAKRVVYAPMDYWKAPRIK
jgi:hypothetical protein